MRQLTPDPAVAIYLDYLRARGRARSCGDVALVLNQYVGFLARRSRTPATATTEDAEAYRALLTTPAATIAGTILAVTTQATRLGIVRSFHRFLKRRGLAMANPAAALQLPRLDQRRVRKDFLTLQEAQAMLTTAAADIDALPHGSKTWATAMRDLAMLALAIATARRSAGLCHLLVSDLHVEQQGLRVSREKGFAGRVLPVVPWAVAVVQAYRDTARPVLLGSRTSPWLFVGQRAERIGQRTWDAIVRRVHHDTVAACPDLTDLPGKIVSTHSLRVTTARLLFLGGCPIRVINELLLHRRLSTTAAYTPLNLDELRRAMVAAHPRA
jgi:site-specific recombinase XerD